MTGVALLADMGTGKTAITLAVIREVGAQRVLVLCPKAVMTSHTWSRQSEQLLVQPVSVIEAEPAPGRSLLQDRIAWAEQQMSVRTPPVVLVLNYEALDSDEVVAWMLQQQFDMLVLDESHRIKSPSGRRARACWKLAAKIPLRIIQTGTLMPHTPMDVWSQFRVIDPGIFGTSVTQFRSQYAVMGGWYGKEITAWKNEQELHEKINTHSYRVGADVLDLPEVRHEAIYVELNWDTKKLARQLETEFYVQIEQGKEITVTNVLVQILRQQQLTSGFATTDKRELIRVDDAKQRALEDLLDSLAPPRLVNKQRIPGEPLVVFCKFRHDLDVVCEAATNAGFVYAELSGRRDELLKWQAGEADVLGVQIQAGGMGIDLTRARYAVYYSVGYSLGDYLQSIKRVHRPGQTRPVVYYHLVARGHIDEAVYESLQAHADVVNRILDRIRERVPIAHVTDDRDRTVLPDERIIFQNRYV